MAEPVSVVPDAPPAARYTIDGGLVGQSRLDVLAEVMWPTSAALLAAAGVPVGARCLDLGCGGGHVSVELAGLSGRPDRWSASTSTLKSLTSPERWPRSVVSATWSFG